MPFDYKNFWYFNRRRSELKRAFLELEDLTRIRSDILSSLERYDIFNEDNVLRGTMIFWWGSPAMSLKSDHLLANSIALFKGHCGLPFGSSISNLPIRDVDASRDFVATYLMSTIKYELSNEFRLPMHEIEKNFMYVANGNWIKMIENAGYTMNSSTGLSSLFDEVSDTDGHKLTKIQFLCFTLSFEDFYGLSEFDRTLGGGDENEGA